MNILLWVLQVLAALLYGASGIMKVFMFDKISGEVTSFGALPREAWMALGIVIYFAYGYRRSRLARQFPQGERPVDSMSGT